MRKTIAIILALCLTMLILPATGEDVSEGYGLYVSGEEVKPDNEADILGDGKVSYSPETRTLYLKGAASTGATILLEGTGSRKLISIYARNDLKIRVSDKCVIGLFGTPEIDEAWFGIRCEGNLTISGTSAEESTLMVAVCNRDETPVVQAKDAYGIWCGGDLEINTCYIESGCREAAAGFEDAVQHGIYCKGLMKVTGAMVAGYTAEQTLGSGTVGVEIRNLEFERSIIVGASGNSGFTFSGILTPDEYQNLAYLGLFSTVYSGDQYDASDLKADQLANFMKSGYSRRFVRIQPQQ